MGTIQVLQQKDVDIQIVDMASSRSGEKYFIAELVGDDFVRATELDVRVYGANHPKGIVWENWDGYFNATIKKAVNLNGEMYLLVDLRSMEAREWAPENEEGPKDADFLWHNNVKIDREQWVQRTDCGCANCTQKPSPFTQEFVVWINPNDFLCADCGTNKRVLEAINKQVG